MEAYMTLHEWQQKEDVYFSMKVICFALKGTAGTDRQTDRHQTHQGLSGVCAVHPFLLGSWGSGLKEEKLCWSASLLH